MLSPHIKIKHKQLTLKKLTFYLNKSIMKIYLMKIYNPKKIVTSKIAKEYLSDIL